MSEQREHIIGLRFSRHDRKRMRQIADDLRANRPEGADMELHMKALESAERDEPLAIRAEDPSEIDLFLTPLNMLGVYPTIEELRAPVP